MSKQIVSENSVSSSYSRVTINASLMKTILPPPFLSRSFWKEGNNLLFVLEYLQNYKQNKNLFNSWNSYMINLKKKILSFYFGPISFWNYYPRQTSPTDIQIFYFLFDLIFVNQ